MIKILTFALGLVKKVIHFLKLAEQYYIGTAAVAAAIFAAALSAIGVTDDAALTVSVAVVGALAGVIAKMKYKNSTSGVVLVVRASKEHTGGIWYKFDAPVDLRKLKNTDYKRAVDSEGNVYDVESGMLIGEVRVKHD